jgi:hypothetical protein
MKAGLPSALPDPLVARHGLHLGRHRRSNVEAETASTSALLSRAAFLGPPTDGPVRIHSKLGIRCSRNPFTTGVAAFWMGCPSRVERYRRLRPDLVVASGAELT